MLEEEWRKYLTGVRMRVVLEEGEGSTGVGMK